jgi:DNA-binding NtrC family response regulator
MPGKLSSTGQAPTVLIVEDDDSIRTVLRELLRCTGHQVIECAHANEALAVLDRSAGVIGIMIADYVLPGMNGMALARAVTRNAPWIHTLIISGHRAPEVECRRSEGLHFLAKPFGTTDLLRALKKFELPRPKTVHAVHHFKPAVAVGM